jgi:hypothetical protein
MRKSAPKLIGVSGKRFADIVYLLDKNQFYTELNLILFCVGIYKLE